MLEVEAAYFGSLLDCMVDELRAEEVCTQDLDCKQTVGGMVLVAIGIGSSQNAVGCRLPVEEVETGRQP